MEHSKLPWKISGMITVRDSDDKFIASPSNVANAKYIVKACNAYPDLVELVNEYQGVLLLLNAISPAEGHRLTDCECLRCQGLEKIEAALREAGELT